MTTSMTVGKRFAMTSGIVLFLLCVFAAIVLVVLNRIDSNIVVLTTDAVPGTFYSATMEADVMALRGDLMRDMLEKDPAQLATVEQHITDDWAQLNADMKSYEDSITQEVDRQQFNALKPQLAAIQQGWEKVHPICKQGRTAEAYQLYMSDMSAPIISLRKQLVDMVQWNKKYGDATVAKTVSAASWGRWLSLLTAFVAILAGIGVSWFMITALKKELNRAISELTEGAEQIASAATQVSASSQSLAQGSSEQAASIEETSASSEEINSMARKNTDNAHSMDTLMTESEVKFNKTNLQLESMVVSMDEINKSSDKISKIIKVIDEIAFQTNILALNAAVEAARAGEAGMGFAVVADEVRSLAQRSAQAAKDTAVLIEESISKSNDGKSKVDEVAAAIRGITADSSKIKVLVDEVTLGSEEQSRGFEQIAKAIAQMEQVTQTTAANAEESAAAAEELNAQSETLKDVVGRLNAMVTGAGGSGQNSGFAGSLHSDHVGLSNDRAARSGSSRTVRPSSPKSSVSTAWRTGRPSGSADAEGKFPLEPAFREF
jgi:methyl-accepting chemotaxis protein